MWRTEIASRPCLSRSEPHSRVKLHKPGSIQHVSWLGPRQSDPLSLTAKWPNSWAWFGGVAARDIHRKPRVSSHDRAKMTHDESKRVQVWGVCQIRFRVQKHDTTLCHHLIGYICASFALTRSYCGCKMCPGALWRSHDCSEHITCVHVGPRPCLWMHASAAARGQTLAPRCPLQEKRTLHVRCVLYNILCSPITIRSIWYIETKDRSESQSLRDECILLEMKQYSTQRKAAESIDIFCFNRTVCVTCFISCKCHQI